jgi:hypothetical protein
MKQYFNTVPYLAQLSARVSNAAVEVWKSKPKIDFGYVLDFLRVITWRNVPGHYNKIGIQV